MHFRQLTVIRYLLCSSCPICLILDIGFHIERISTAHKQREGRSGN